MCLLRTTSKGVFHSDIYKLYTRYSLRQQRTVDIFYLDNFDTWDHFIRLQKLCLPGANNIHRIQELSS